MSSGPHRLASGGQIDRATCVRFRFNETELQGFAGDTLASALLGAGVSLVGRSFKYHRPRGILSAGVEEPNALVTIGTGARAEPNVRATMQTLYEGLVASSQNHWPSLRFDAGRLNDFVHGLLPAGFYNKTFMWPSWHTWEPLIRRMAGLGKAPVLPDPDCYSSRNAHCDVLVIGGGRSGLLAARNAARAGARVILVESDRVLGGSLNWQREDTRDARQSPDDVAASFAIANSLGRGERLPEGARQGQEDVVAHSAIANSLGRGERPPESARQGPENAAAPFVLASSLDRGERLPESAQVRVLLRTTAVAAYDHGLVAAVEHADPTASPQTSRWRQRWWRIRAKRIVLATGAIEQPLAFPWNDRPGIMLAGAVRQYLNRYAVAVGHRVAVVTNNDSAYAAALDLRAKGLAVPCLLDTRSAPPSELVSSATAAGVTVLPGAEIVRTHGRTRVSGITVRADSGRSHYIDCDALAMSGGWNPVAHLYCQAGGKLKFNEHHACLVPDGQHEFIQAVGRAAGEFDEHGAQADRRLAATGKLGYHAASNRSRVWLDFQHDVTVSDIDLAVRENLVSVEHVKRYTTAGMAVDQGKTANLNTLAVVSALTQRPMADIGVTTFRPMFVPVTFGTIAAGRNGEFYRARRKLPLHQEHEQCGALFEEYSAWMRPSCYPKPGETRDAAILREAKTVRAAAGLFDGSPLGKLLVRGPDAARFLDRMYIQSVASLKPNRVRYGLMLTEQGIVMDDGVCARLAEDEFWINTTSAGAGRICGWLEEWLQCEWPDLQAIVTDVTSQWATLNVAGPRAREILRSLPGSIDLSREAFPHMHVRSGELCGVPCRILRVSFTGEMSYEISVPASFGPMLWKRILAAGEPMGLVPFGIEALQLLRTEKGYLHVGSDTDGSTVPDDVGFGTGTRAADQDFVGRRSLSLPANRRSDRLQLVGLRCVGDSSGFVAGAHLLIQPSDANTEIQRPQLTAGYLTSAVYSPELDCHVGLGLLRGGRNRMGQTITVIDGVRTSRALVVNPSHVDPGGVRLHE